MANQIHSPRSTLRTPRSLVSALLAWFATHARDLPWRRTRDPYAIWVSEIMLQQTQVKTVIPYWERWLRELPTVESLAKARPEKIHKLWEGLGYYTRVRNMQKAAQQIVKSNIAKPLPTQEPTHPQPLQGGEPDNERRETVPLLGGVRGGLGGTNRNRMSVPPSPHPKARGKIVAARFPDNFEAILALPGIGRYTAGAISSIAFNQPAPILDGNVIRVLTRLHGIAEDPKEKKTNARLWQHAEELVSHASRITHEGIKSKITIKIKKPAAPPCSALNQSLMELGALICTPRSPNCPACPVAKHCTALRENRIAELPRPKQRALVTARRFIAFIVERQGEFLIQQRAEGGVNAHLWEFPNVEVLAKDSVAAVAKANFAAKPVAMEKLCVVKHSITRYRMTTEAYRISFGEMSYTSRQSAGIWRTLAQLHKLPFTSAHRQIATRLGNP